MSGLEERERAVELYFTTPMTTAQVVEHLGYPTRQCLERWLAMDSRYAGHMAKPIIPLETRRRAVELVLGGMQQKQAAKQLGVSVGAVHGWVRAYRKGGMAALQPKNRNSAQGNKPADSRRRPSAADDDDAEALRRRVEELELCFASIFLKQFLHYFSAVWAAGFQQELHHMTAQTRTGTGPPCLYIPET